ncbi:hypothetical protein GA830_12105 [Mesorhizobium sp. NBSH29]|uniref:hypothetical protein n=1 Tax=Mesorhizobium sp. NBSH29 TaxID=2654249 RepID=UPI0018967633|nr:hypothetical protein [Mesorhizobium sp. NBSH29]QPC87400.1 hypothetical protein GA830_12105 [Mesorhizobium sp. NBSH29]
MKHVFPPDKARKREADDPFVPDSIYTKEFLARVRAKRQAAEVRNLRAEKMAFPHAHDILREATDWRIRADVDARLGERPARDKRDLTGRVFGDPLPGQSALDRGKRERRDPDHPPAKGDTL